MYNASGKTAEDNNKSQLPCFTPHSHGYMCRMQGYGRFPFLLNTAARRKKKKLRCILNFRMADSFPLPPISGLGYKLWNRDPEALYFRPSFYALVKLLSSSFPPATPQPPFINWRYKKRNKQKSPQKPITG